MNNIQNQRPPSFLRLVHIIGDRKANPPIPAIIPVSESTWNNGVKSGVFPKPVKLGKRMNGWRADDIYALSKRLSEAA